MRLASLGVLFSILPMAMGLGVAHGEEPRQLEPVVVTATKIETPAEQLGAAVSVVTGEDFETYRYETVAEALRSVPGLEVRQSGSPGKTTSVTIRGANANQVQVLIDGVRVKSPTTGQADFSDISADLIERVEVIRGPQSALYGADAIGGVVNIITRKGKGPLSGFFEQDAGNYGTLRSRIGASGSHGILDYSFGASHLESAGQFSNDDSDQNSVTGRLGLALPWNGALDFILRYNRTDTRLPIRFVDDSGVAFFRLPISPALDVNARQQSETLVTSLAARTRPVAWWESDLRLSRYENNVGFQDPQDPGVPCLFAPCDVVSQTDVERREVEWVNHFHEGRWGRSSIGLEYRHEHGDIGGNSPGFSARTSTDSAFVEQQVRFLDRLFVTGGVRVEHHSVFGTEATGRGSVAFVIRDTGTRLRGSAGSGFRAPTFNDLFFPGFGNTSLQPERSVSFDLGVDQKLWANRIRLALTYFHNEFENLIACCVSLPAPPFVTTGNIGRARSAGIEFTSEVDLLDTLLATVDYTYTDSENLTTGRLLPREPRHRWNIGLIWTPGSRLSLFTQVHTTSRQWEPLGEVYNSGHTRVDVGGQYRLFERFASVQSLDLTARVQNLLDEGYAEVRGFPALGTNFLIGLRATF